MSDGPERSEGAPEATAGRIADLCAEWRRLLKAAEVAGDAMPWCWEMTGEKGNDWVLGVAVTQRGDAVLGELRDPDDECLRLHRLCGSEGDGEHFGVPALIVWMRNHAEEILAALDRAALREGDPGAAREMAAEPPAAPETPITSVVIGHTRRDGDCPKCGAHHDLNTLCALPVE